MIQFLLPLIAPLRFARPAEDLTLAATGRDLFQSVVSAQLELNVSLGVDGMPHDPRSCACGLSAREDHIRELFILVAESARFQPPMSRAALQPLRKVAPIFRPRHRTPSLMRTRSQQTRLCLDELLARREYKFVAARRARLNDHERYSHLLPRPLQECREIAVCNFAQGVREHYEIE